MERCYSRVGINPYQRKLKPFVFRFKIHVKRKCYKSHLRVFRYRGTIDSRICHVIFLPCLEARNVNDNLEWNSENCV